MSSVPFGLARGRSASTHRAGLRGWDRFDYIMVLSAFGLVAYSLALIHSSAHGVYDGPFSSFQNPVIKQGVFAILGVITMLVVSRIDYHRISYFAWVGYIAAVISLIAVLVVGTTTAGSTRWFDLGFVQLQPSELAKLVTILCLARMFDSTDLQHRHLRVFLMSLALVVPIAGLVFIEPDLGTAVMFGAIWVGMVIVARIRATLLMVVVGLGLAMLPFVATFALADYQVDRIAALVDPYEDAQGEGYNNIQSQIAIGSGQIFGKGLSNGEQTQRSFLKVPTSDFIFSVLGEELGFVGAMGLFGLLILLLMRAIRAAQIASDVQGQLIASGIVVMILSQAFINIAVNLSLFPVTGIPLPFVSQGGSSMVTMFASLGLLQSIILRHRTYRQI